MTQSHARLAENARSFGQKHRRWTSSRLNCRRGKRDDDHGTPAGGLIEGVVRDDENRTASFLFGAGPRCEVGPVDLSAFQRLLGFEERFDTGDLKRAVQVHVRTAVLHGIRRDFLV